MRRRWFANDEEGQAVVLLALALTGLLAAGGLAIDAGLQYVERRHEQVAADSAAYAAAATMVENWNAPNRAVLAAASARDYAARNGYNNDQTTNTVTVNIPPASGAFQGNADYAEVIIAVDVKTAFVRVLGAGFVSRNVQGRAVGAITSPPKPYAVIALSKTASPGLQLNGNGQLEVEDAGVLVNSSASSALTTTSNTQIEAPNVDVVGQAQVNGSVSGTVTTGAPAQSDPLAYLVPPSPTGLTTYPAVNATGGTVTLDPGIYPSISASGNAVVRLRPGTYVIAGGGISVSGNGRIQDDTAGNGVFIYNTCSNYPLTGGTCGAISVSGNGRFDLENSDSGKTAGVSIWQSCDNTQEMTIVGSGQRNHDSNDTNGELETSGSVYLPCASVSVSGVGELEVEGGQLIAQTITVSGNGEIEVEWNQSAQTPNRAPAVVE